MPHQRGRLAALDIEQPACLHIERAGLRGRGKSPDENKGGERQRGRHFPHEVSKPPTVEPIACKSVSYSECSCYVLIGSFQLSDIGKNAPLVAEGCARMCFIN